MNTRSTEKCISRDANSNEINSDSCNHAPLIATNDEHLSLVKTVPDMALKFAETRWPARKPVSDQLFQQILLGMGVSLVAMVMVIAAIYPTTSVMQKPASAPFTYQHLIG
jgi:hypothetical protein